MRTRRSPRTGNAMLRLGGRVILAALVVGPQTGCTREFFREWANQDVSEAIFEKSRDPRWRLDTFSIEPPALSRFADPYDQDAPPAPPDDVVAEALSPVPQWPSNRLIVPVEGTGYLDLLEYWKRQNLAAAGLPPTGPPPPPDSPVAGLPPNLGVGGFPLSISTDPASRQGIPFVPYPGMANPFVPGAIIEPERGDRSRPAARCHGPADRTHAQGEPAPGPDTPGRAARMAPGAGAAAAGARLARLAQQRLPGPPPGSAPARPATPRSAPGLARLAEQRPPAGTPRGAGASADLRRVAPVRSDHPDRPPPGRAGRPPRAGTVRSGAGRERIRGRRPRVRRQ